MGDQVASFGLRFVRPGERFAETAEAELSERAGWQDSRLTVPTVHGPKDIPAKVWNQFAVHHMLRDPGFTISAVKDGSRLSSGGRVFARSADAMHVAEALNRLHPDWHHVCFALGWPEHLRRQFNAAFNALPGEAYLKDLVYPI